MIATVDVGTVGGTPTGGREVVAVALNSVVMGKGLDRIAGHAAVIGSRLRQLITGDAAHLAVEIR